MTNMLQNWEGLVGCKEKICIYRKGLFLLVYGEANVDIHVQPKRVPHHKNQQQADYLSRINVDIDDWWNKPRHNLLRWMSLET